VRQLHQVFSKPLKIGDSLSKKKIATPLVSSISNSTTVTNVDKTEKDNDGRIEGLFKNRLREKMLLKKHEDETNKLNIVKNTPIIIDDNGKSKKRTARTSDSVANPKSKKLKVSRK
jgi:hypothetical protein